MRIILLFTGLLLLTNCIDSNLTSPIVYEDTIRYQSISEEDAKTYLYTLAGIGGKETYKEITRVAKKYDFYYNTKASYLVENSKTGMHFIVFPTSANKLETGDIHLVYALHEKPKINEKALVAGGFFSYEKYAGPAENKTEVRFLNTNGDMVRELIIDYDNNSISPLPQLMNSTQKGWWSDFTDCLDAYVEVATSSSMNTLACGAAGALCAGVGISGCAGAATGVAFTRPYDCCDWGAIPHP